MKNIVNRALVAKKKQFQSKSVPRGTRTIWRYLGALFILFTFAIGNVWGINYYTPTADEVIVLKDNTSHACITSLPTSTSTDYKCGDPENGGAQQSTASTTYCVKGNSGKVFKIAVAGCSEVVVYHNNHNSRHIKTTLTPSVGDATTQEGTNGTLTTSITLDGAKSYELWIQGWGTSASDLYVYAIKLKKASGSTQTAPAITNPSSTPDLAEITAGETKQFSVTATGNPAPTYQWYSCDDAEKTNPSSIGSATSASYTTANSLAVGTYYYYCVATNSKGSATSAVFSLKVNELGGDLTAHTPGVYTKAADKGGYGQSLVTYQGREYEIIAMVKNNSKNFWFAGTKSSTPSDAHCLSTEGFTTSFTPAKITGAWMKGTFSALGSNTSSSIDEFPAISSYCSAKITTATATSVMIKVQGYDQISFYAKDASSKASDNKHLVVKVNGVEKSMTLNTSYSVRRFTLDPTQTSVVEITGSTASGESHLVGFSLRLPQAEKHHVTYALNGGTGTTPTQADVAEGAKFTLHNGITGITAPTNKDFDGWHDGKNKYAGGAEYTMGTSDVELTAQWKDHVAKYTVIYKDGTTELGSETVEVGKHPTGSEIADPTKDCYTFAAWSPALSTVSGTDGATVYVNATWTGNYFTTSVDFEKDGESAVSGIASKNIVASNAGSYDGGKAEENWAYKGWKIKSNGATVKVLVEANKKLTYKFGYLAAAAHVNITNDNITREVTGASKEEGNPLKYTTYSYITDYDAVYTFTTGSADAAVIKALSVEAVYTAYFEDEMGVVTTTVVGNVTEVELPTPSVTTKSGKNFIGWKANKAVTVDDVVVDANTLIAAGKIAVLSDNTTFTTQWVAPENFNVKFYQGYGEPDVQIGETQSISTGKFAEAPADPTRTGFVFLGWSYDATEAHIVDVAAYGITAATDFTAMWKAVWTVTFDGAGAVNVENGETVASPDSPTQAGKVFQGWYNGESKYDFSATVTGNLALTSKWADADPNHYVYAYNDDFHFDGVVYKTPEGKTTNPEADEATLNLTTPYTLFSGAKGITSIVATKAIYDYKKGDNTKHITAYLKLKKSSDDANSKLIFTIASGYTAVLKVKMGGYSKTPTVTLKKGDDVVTGTPATVSGKAEDKDYAEITYNLVAGIYEMTTADQTLYFSHIDLQATPLPTYSVTYKAGEGTGDDVVDANTYYAGDEVTLMANPFTAPNGYVWSAWSAKDEGDTDVEITSGKITMPASNVTVTAQWVVDNGMARLYRSDDTEDANSPYATLAAAVAAAQDGDKIVLQRNVVDGAGIMLTKDDHKTLTIDFGGYTYTAVTPGVGSVGTQNQAFHLEKGNTVTLKNGTIACSGSEIKMLIQNYCDLTLEDITLDGTGLEGSHRYVMSNNCGDVVIGNGTTITAKDGDVAFDVCATNYYPEGVTVTVKDGATISGIVEYDVWGTKPADNKAELAIEGGTLNITWNVESALAEDAKANLNVSGGAFAEVVPLDYCAEGFIPVTEADPITGKYAVTPGYKVTFMDGSEELEKVAVAEGSAVAEKELAGKMGYDFDAWYTENTFENAWDFATVVTADMSLYAKWTAFEGCTELWPATSGDALIVGAMVELQTGSKGGSIKVANLGAAGSISYNANGLSFSNGGNDSVLVTLNNDLKNGSVIKVRLMANGGTKNNGRGLNLLNAARVMKALLGWQANEEVTSGDIREFTYTVVESDGFAGTNVFTLQRQNSVFLQSIKVEECGDAIVYHNLTSAVNIAGKGTVTLGATSVREGYTTTATYSEIDPLYEFVNWTVSGADASIADASANPATITMGTEDAIVTLNLQLIPVKFTVNYYDGTTSMGTEQVAVNEHPTASEIETAKRHYTFLGWSLTDGGDIVALNTITRTEATTVDLFAKYEAIPCPTSGTIFLMEFDDTKTPSETVKVAKNGGTLDVADYATISGGSAQYINDETSDKDAITTDGKFKLAATKEVLKIELECALQEGDIIRVLDNSNKYVISTSKTKTGTYKAQTSSDHEYAVTAAWAGVDDIYLLYDGSGWTFTNVEVYRPAKFDVSFNMMGHGTQIADIEDVIEGSKITAPTAPTDADYSFAGWYKENTLANEWKFDVDVVEANTTLYAKWLDKSDATLKSLKYGAEEIALQAGVYTYNVELPALTTAVPALSAETSNPNATKVITDETAFDAEGHATSKVVVTPEKVGAATQTYTVNFAKAASVALQDVTGSITWDFNGAVTADVNINNTLTVIANYAGVSLDGADKLEVKGTKFMKSPACVRANKMHFYTTVPGKLTVEYSNTGGSNPVRYLYVNGVKYDETGTESTAKKGENTKVFVPAGDVELVMMDGSDASKELNIYRIIFNATPDYERSVSNNIGTLCVDHNVPAGQYLGATFYQIASRNELYNDKIDFEEVLPNEELKAGEPYIFKSTTGKIELFYGETEADAPVAVRGMIGSFVDAHVDITSENMSDILYIANNRLWNCEDMVNSYLDVVANRAYIVMSNVPEYSAPQQNSAPRRRVSLGMNSEQVATGCENLNVSDKPVKMIINGQLFILRGEKMYDAKGQLVK